jgi:hypothetical protein
MFGAFYCGQTYFAHGDVAMPTPPRPQFIVPGLLTRGRRRQPSLMNGR